MNVDTLESFSDPALKEKITNIFPKYGENIFNITSSISKTVLNWRDALVSINNIVKDSSSTLNKASDTLNTVENVNTGVNVVVFIFFIIALVPIILLFIPRVSPFVPRVFAYICGAVVSLLIIVVLIMDPVVNNIVKGMISELNDYINYQINLILTQLLGDKSGILDLLGGIKGNYITLTTKISAGWRIILSLLAYIGAIISTYFIPGKKTVKIVKDEVIENKEIK